MKKQLPSTNIKKKSLDSTAKDAGSAALAVFMPRLLKLPKAQINQPRTDVAAAATVALGVAQKLRDKAMRDGDGVRISGFPSNSESGFPDSVP